MYELAWIALGVAATLVALWFWRARGDAGGRAPAEAPAVPARELTTTVEAESRAMARSLAEELANLVSAVDGRAHHLIEAAPTRAQLPAAAEALLRSITGLRTLHKKLVAFGQDRAGEPGRTDVCELIDGLGDELQQMQLGLELRWDPPEQLPPIEVGPSVARDIMLFVCAALLRAERGATRLTFAVERSFSRERPTVKIALNLEQIEAESRGSDHALPDQAFALDLEAARQLVQAHAGELTLSHLPGKSVLAVVRLPMSVPEPAGDDGAGAADRDLAAAGDRAPHHFGGALVLESDPALRAVLARELKASGRAVFACADGASAHTFLEATPDRFELLIVDDARQLDEHTPLARTIRSRAPELKICVLTPRADGRPATWPDAHHLRKPFGVHELRRTLASILPAG